MSADKIVKLHRQDGATDHTLAPSSAQGEARLRELENLLKTAAEVQAQAEAELNSTESAQSVARQRKAAADSVRRKAEAEMARLRAQLAREAQQTRTHWAPGDPVPGPRQNRHTGGDFEVSMVTGTASRGRFSDSAFLDSDLALDEEDRPLNGRANATRAGSQARKPPPRKSGHYPHSRKARRGWGLGLIMLLGISAGAAGTWMAVQEPQMLNNAATRVTAQLQQWLPEKPPPAAFTPRQTSNRPVSEARTPVTQRPTAAAPPSQASNPTWQQAVTRQEQRLREAAELRFRDRIRAE